MKKHKARRLMRQTEETPQAGKFNPRNHHQCMSESCRRAKKCLGRAMICGCTVHYFAVSNRTDAEKLRRLRKALGRAVARAERREARGLTPRTPEDPNVTPEEQEKAIREEIARWLEAFT